MGWSLGELRTIMRRAVHEEFSQGTVLFRQDDPGDRVFLIRSGLVEIFADSGGVRRRLNLRARGEIIGEMALLDGLGRSATAVARTHVKALSLDANSWQQLLQRHPSLIHGLTRQLSLRMRQLQATLSAELDRRDQAQPINLTLIGPFRLLEKLGEGGMGVIYAAIHTGNQQEKAVKVLPVGTELQKARFTSECESMARLVHPNVVRIDSAGLHGDLGYFSMELLRGETLDQRLQRGPLTQGEVLPWFSPAFEALAHAHDRGVMHRDIKPANLFLTLDGSLKVLDFGIARRVNGPSLTVEGKFFGTPQYLAPERIGGQSDSLVRQSDQYSLGVTLYQALTGRCPFEDADIAEVFAGHLHRPPPPPHQWCSLSPALEAVVLRLLHKDPLRRFPHLQAAQQALLQSLASGSWETQEWDRQTPCETLTSRQ